MLLLIYSLCYIYNMNVETPQGSTSPERVAKPSLLRLAGYFAWLGTVGFGGPIALTERMQRDLVGVRRWFVQAEFLEGLALAQLAPGPLAAQLAIYLGYLHSGVIGAAIIGLAFVVPSFLMVLGIAAAYVHYSGLPWVQAAFSGIGPAVIAVIANATIKLTVKVVGRDLLLWVILLALAATTALLESEIVWLFLGAGVLTAIIRGKPRVRGMICYSPLFGAVNWPVLGQLPALFLFFAEASLFVFGSGLAIIPFLHASVVQERHWLTEQQFIDAVAVAMITPGPVVITVAFIGYIVEGPVGACVSAFGVFFPSFLVVVLLTPVYRRFAKAEIVRAFVAGVTAAATGAIAGAAIVLARQSIVDARTAIFALAALVAVRLRAPETLVVLAAGLVGLLLSPW